jgi:hypothetical protein
LDKEIVQGKFVEFYKSSVAGVEALPRVVMVEHVGKKLL